LSPAHSRSQFSLWAILAAPLLIGGPIANLSPWDMETYLNKEVIAVNQDSNAKQGIRLTDVSYSLLHPHAVWGRELADGGLAAVFINFSLFFNTKVQCDHTCWAKTPFKDGTTLLVRDLWEHASASIATVVVPNTYTVDVPFDGASVMLRFTPKKDEAHKMLVV